MAGKRRPKVNFKKAFDWFSFNRTFLEPARGHRIAIAIDPCYIPKSGKKTPGIDWFWSGCASAMKKGLEMPGISIVDADARDSIFLKAEQCILGIFPLTIREIPRVGYYYRIIFALERNQKTIRL